MAARTNQMRNYERFLEWQSGFCPYCKGKNISTAITKKGSYRFTCGDCGSSNTIGLRLRGYV